MVFTKADKEGATVILDVKKYIEKPNKELMRIITRNLTMICHKNTHKLSMAQLKEWFSEKIIFY